MRILFLFLLPAFLFGQSNAALERAVLAANDQVTHAAEARDAEKFFSFFADTTKGSVIQDGVLSLTPRGMRARVEPGFRQPVKVEFRWKQQHVTVLAPDTVLLVSEGDTLVTTDKGTATQPFAQSMVWVLRNGAWKILHAHQSIPKN
jgi:uncharacterized protein (TIGR02246 family)